MRSLKILGLLIVTGALTGVMTNQVKAQADRGGGGNLGIGAMFGEPTGISVKSWNNERTAFDVGAAWSLTEDEALHMHTNFLIHSWFEDTEDLAFYYGIGGRVIFADDSQVGVRVPLGLNYVFPEGTFDIFVEAVPIMDLTPETEFAGNGAVGIRYYF